MKSRNLILTGFAFVIVLMALIIFISITELENSSLRLQELVSVNNAKQKLVKDMNISAFKRVSSLQRMVLLRDAFEQDDEAMFIDLQAGFFIQARQNLQKSHLNNAEKELLKLQGEYVKTTVPIIKIITQMVRDENYPDAKTLIQDKLIPAQQKIFDALDKLQKIQEDNIDIAFQDMFKAHQFSRFYMLGLGLAAAFLSIFIALTTYKRVHLAEKLLSQEKERAQITLNNIVDGVITTDTTGQINYINPSASILTGWKQHLAIGQPLLNVLHLIDTSQEKTCETIDEFKHCKQNELILVTRENEQIPIEHNTSLLPSNSPQKNSLAVTFRNVTEARALTQILSFQATHDRLTNLKNRLFFEENLTKRINEQRSQNKTHVLCFIDLDHFKHVNDTAGHIAGDELLIHISTIFSKHIRNTDLLARIGGDEFAIILGDCDIQKALQITENIRKEVDEFIYSYESSQYHISASIGLTLFNNQAKSINEVIEQADKACYLAKEAGRNQVRVFQNPVV